MSNSNTDNQELRRSILSWLAPRYPLAHSAATIARRVGHDLGERLGTETVLACLCFLTERGFVRTHQDRVTGGDCYAASADGVAEWERSKG